MPKQTALGARSSLLSKGITLDVFIQGLVELLEGEDLQDVISFGVSASPALRSSLALATLPPDVVATRR